MINKGESEIHGCKVNVRWSRKELCTITKVTVRFRKIKPQGDHAEWTEYNVTSTTSYLLHLECDKGYEIAVSSWFGEVQSDWSVSWKFKTLSAGATLSYVHCMSNKSLYHNVMFGAQFRIAFLPRPIPPSTLWGQSTNGVFDWTYFKSGKDSGLLRKKLSKLSFCFQNCYKDLDGVNASINFVDGR